jgi:hypothetical protein
MVFLLEVKSKKHARKNGFNYNVLKEKKNTLKQKRTF